MKTLKLNKIKVDKVMQVYSGRPGCMCGCRGNYRVASKYVAEANKNCGYDISDCVNDVQVRRVVKIIEANAAAAEVYPECVCVEVNGRVYAAYFVVQS